jgi:GNAT superfamily N-acetyltransferase
MNEETRGQLRAATLDDIEALLALWELLYREVDLNSSTRWQAAARDWFERSVDAPASTRIPVVTVGTQVVATAIGTVELGVPNPFCPTGRTVRLANVITLSAHRGQGHGTRLVHDIVAWARSVHADRVDLSATPDGQRIYEQLGFTLTSAPRMKLVLGGARELG